MLFENHLRHTDEVDWPNRMADTTVEKLGEMTNKVASSCNDGLRCSTSADIAVFMTCTTLAWVALVAHIGRLGLLPLCESKNGSSELGSMRIKYEYPSHPTSNDASATKYMPLMRMCWFSSLNVIRRNRQFATIRSVLRIDKYIGLANNSVRFLTIDGFGLKKNALKSSKLQSEFWKHMQPW